MLNKGSGGKGLLGIKEDLGPLYTIGKWSLLLSNPSLLVGYGALKIGPAIIGAATSERAMKKYAQIGKATLKTTGKVAMLGAKYSAKVMGKGLKWSYNYLKNRDCGKIKDYISYNKDRFTNKLAEFRQEHQYKEDFENAREHVDPFEFKCDSIENAEFAENFEEVLNVEESEDIYNKILAEMDAKRENNVESEWDMEVNGEETIENVSLDEDMDIYFTKDRNGIIRKYICAFGNPGEPQILSQREYQDFVAQARQINIDKSSVEQEHGEDFDFQQERNQENEKIENRDVFDTVIIDSNTTVLFTKDVNGQIHQHFSIYGDIGPAQKITEEAHRSFIEHVNNAKEKQGAEITKENAYNLENNNGEELSIH